MRSTFLLFLFFSLSIYIRGTFAVCCEPRPYGFCHDGYFFQPNDNWCGVGSCNIFGCNCDGGMSIPLSFSFPNLHLIIAFSSTSHLESRRHASQLICNPGCRNATHEDFCLTFETNLNKTCTGSAAFNDHYEECLYYKDVLKDECGVVSTLTATKGPTGECRCKGESLTGRGTSVVARSTNSSTRTRMTV